MKSFQVLQINGADNIKRLAVGKRAPPSLVETFDK
jgi:hypothetical protein